MLITSFYDNAFSRQFAVRLRRSSESLGIKCRLFNRTERGKAPPGTGWMPKFLFDTLKAYPDDDLLLIEPDTSIHRRPDILLDEKDYDVAVHYDSETLAASGPVFVANNRRVQAMIPLWEELDRRYPERSELDNLSEALGRRHSGLVVRRLPVTYAWIEQDHRTKYPRALPVFTHFKTDHLSSTRIKIPS